MSRKLWVILDGGSYVGCKVVAVKLSEEDAQRYIDENEPTHGFEVKAFDWLDAYPRRRRSVYGVLKRPFKEPEEERRLKRKSAREK